MKNRKIHKMINNQQVAMEKSLRKIKRVKNGTSSVSYTFYPVNTHSVMMLNIL